MNFQVLPGVIAQRERLDSTSKARMPFGHSNVVICLFLVTNIKRYRLLIISKNA